MVDLNRQQRFPTFNGIGQSQKSTNFQPVRSKNKLEHLLRIFRLSWLIVGEWRYLMNVEILEPEEAMKMHLRELTYERNVGCYLKLKGLCSSHRYSANSPSQLFVFDFRIQSKTFSFSLALVWIWNVNTSTLSKDVPIHTYLLCDIWFFDDFLHGCSGMGLRYLRKVNDRMCICFFTFLYKSQAIKILESHLIAFTIRTCQKSSS